MASARSGAAGWRSLIVPGLCTLAGLVLLIGLGVWQVERLHWKEDLLARIDARIHAPPVALPPASEWAVLAATDYDYTHVRASGRLDPSRTAFIFRGASGIPGAPAGPGYWVMVPLVRADGSAILVNRGFIAVDRKERRAAAGAERAAAGETTVTGLLRPPESRGLFTPADNPDKGEWYTRDPGAIAAALHLDRAAPFSIDEDAHAAPPGEPAGGATVFDIPNNHFGYALTWFGLAAALAGVFGVFAARRLRAPVP
jgi:surfeit locus 1 family protein